MAWPSSFTTPPAGSGPAGHNDAHNELVAAVQHLKDNPGGGAPEWGDITGTLADQADLAAALSGYALTSSLADVATSGEAADLDATGATDGHVLTADGAGGAAWEAPSSGGSSGDHGSSGTAPALPSLDYWRHAGHPTTLSTQATTPTRCYLLQLDVDVPCRLTGFAVRVTTGGAGSVIRFGLYDSTTGGRPGSLVAGSDVTAAGDSAAVVEATAGVNIAAGRYWVAVAGQTASCTLRAFIGSFIAVAGGTAAGALPTGTSLPVAYRGDAVGGAMPATQNITQADTTAYLVAVRLGERV